MNNPVTIKISSLQSVDVSPQSIIEYAAELKFRIRMLEDELKEYEPQLVRLAEVNEGKLKADLCEITLCQRKDYQFSEKVAKLEQKRKQIEASIKARQIVEISDGAPCTVKPYLRYNVRMP